MEAIRVHNPWSVSTVVSFKETLSGKTYKIIRWGNTFYLPVSDGDQFGILLENKDSNWKGYPIFAEALNIYEGGKSEPEECSGDDMWELRGYQRMLVEGLHNPNSSTSRPFVVTKSGLGYGIGEATFGTQQYRGQIRIYEKIQFPNSGRPIQQSFTLGGSANKDKSLDRTSASIGAGAEVKFKFGKQLVLNLKTIFGKT